MRRVIVRKERVNKYETGIYQPIKACYRGND